MSITVGQAVAAIGGWTVLVLGVGKWLSDRVAQKLQIEWTAKQNKELETIKKTHSLEIEELRSDLAGKRDDLSSLRNAIMSGQASSHSRIIEGMEKLWKKLLEIRTFTGQIIFVYEIFLSEEFDDQDAQAVCLKYVPENSEPAFTKKLLELQDAEDIRPFVGERLWGLYSTYCSLCFRLAWKVTQGRAKEHIQPWDRKTNGETDNVLLQALSYAFDQSELEYLMNMSRIGAPGRMLQALESKILSEMNQWLFGERYAAMTAEALEALHELQPSSRVRAV